MQIQDDLMKFAKEGLRTLVVGQKDISEQEFKRFEEEFHRLKTSTAKDKDE